LRKVGVLALGPLVLVTLVAFAVIGYSSTFIYIVLSGTVLYVFSMLSDELAKLVGVDVEKVEIVLIVASAAFLIISVEMSLGFTSAPDDAVSWAFLAWELVFSISIISMNAEREEGVKMFYGLLSIVVFFFVVSGVASWFRETYCPDGSCYLELVLLIIGMEFAFAPVLAFLSREE